MKKRTLQDVADDLGVAIDELKKLVNEPKRISCPIKMEDFQDILGIPFNKQKQSLFCWGGVYRVFDCMESKLVDCDLIPYNREDLKPGDVAFRSPIESNNFKDLDKYCVILDDRRCAFILNDEDTIISSRDFYYWYKVERC